MLQFLACEAVAYEGTPRGVLDSGSMIFCKFVGLGWAVVLTIVVLSYSVASDVALS
jgi:hypothetical protein